MADEGPRGAVALAHAQRTDPVSIGRLCQRRRETLHVVAAVAVVAEQQALLQQQQLGWSSTSSDLFNLGYLIAWLNNK